MSRPEVDLVIGEPEPEPEPEPDDGEELPGPPPAARGRRIAAGGAVALAIVGGVLAQRAAPHRSDPVARRTSSGPTRPIAAPADPLRAVELLPACPQPADGEARCRIDTTVPAPVAAAVRASFPALHTLRGVTTFVRTGEAGDALWTRRVSSASGLSVLVRQRSSAEQAAGTNMLQGGGAATAYAQRVAGAYLVSVTVRGERPGPDLVASVAALVADPRLLATR